MARHAEQTHPVESVSTEAECDVRETVDSPRCCLTFNTAPPRKASSSKSHRRSGGGRFCAAHPNRHEQTHDVTQVSVRLGANHFALWRMQHAAHGASSTMHMHARSRHERSTSHITKLEDTHGDWNHYRSAQLYRQTRSYATSPGATHGVIQDRMHSCRSNCDDEEAEARKRQQLDG